MRGNKENIFDHDKGVVSQASSAFCTTIEDYGESTIPHGLSVSYDGQKSHSTS